MNFGGEYSRVTKSGRVFRAKCHLSQASSAFTPKLTLVFPAFQPRRFISESLYVHRPGVCCVLLMGIIITASGIIVNTARDKISPQMVNYMFFLMIYFFTNVICSQKHQLLRV